MSTEPYYELPLSVTKLRSIFHFRVGAHSLTIEQSRIEMLEVPQYLRRCTFCATNAIGDKRHCVFDPALHFQGLRLQHAGTFKDSHDAMRSVIYSNPIMLYIMMLIRLRYGSYNYVRIIYHTIHI